MSTYKGPHVAVDQKFSSAPGDVAVEELPSVVVASAFDVYEDVALGTIPATFAQNYVYGTDQTVVFDESVIGERGYEFYKPVAKVSTRSFGLVNVTDQVTFSEDGVAADAVEGVVFDIPETELLPGAGQAYMPYYKQVDAAQNIVSVKASALDTVVIPSGTLQDSGLVKGQTVSAYDGTNWIKLGEVNSVSPDGKSVRLILPVPAAADYKGIVIGASATNADVPNTIVAPFSLKGARVAAGDIIVFNSDMIDSTTELSASIKSFLSDSVAIIHTGTEPDAIDKIKKITEYKTFDLIGGTKSIYLSEMKCQRLAGFASNMLSLTDAKTAVVDATNKKKLTMLTADLGGLEVGDMIMLEGIDMPEYAGRVATMFESDATHTAILMDRDMYSSADGAVAAGTLTVVTFKIERESDFVCSFRAVRVSDNEAVQRISGIADIENYFGEINPFNELAFMCSIVYGSNGGNVFYARNVNAASPALSAEYAEALEDLKMKDCYSHCLGTTDAAINALLAPYCKQQSEPYQAHERIAWAVYDQDNVYLMGEGSATAAGTGVLSVGFDADAAEINIGDDVRLFKSGKLIAEDKVLASPTASTITVKSNYIAGEIDYVEVRAGRKFVQADKISALGNGERRVKTIWPGYFEGEVNGERVTLPPYYLAAAYAGKDDGESPSQSFTNLETAIPGVSNISLGTDTHFNVSDLDIIGEGGINILVQGGQSISQIIASRHDLTNDMTDILSREGSITKQVDTVAKTLRSVVRPYVGKYNITPRLIDTVGQICKIAANKLVKQGVTAGVSIDKVERDKDIADKIVIAVSVKVYVAGNYYDITLNVGV